MTRRPAEMPARAAATTIRSRPRRAARASTTPIFGAPGTNRYTDVLFTHWEDDYDAILTALLAGPLALSVLHGELDRVTTVAGDALDADPQIVGETAADVVSRLATWWSARHLQVVAELDAHGP